MTEADASTGDGGEGEGGELGGQLRGLDNEQEQFKGLCAELNMDVETGDLAWKTYLATKCVQNISIPRLDVRAHFAYS